MSLQKKSKTAYKIYDLLSRYYDNKSFRLHWDTADSMLLQITTSLDNEGFYLFRDSLKEFVKFELHIKVVSEKLMIEPKRGEQ